MTGLRNTGGVNTKLTVPNRHTSYQRDDFNYGI